jgi:hypothetical protein
VILNFAPYTNVVFFIVFPHTKSPNLMPSI